MSITDSQLLADIWEAVAPFGLTKDGKVAPAMAEDSYGEAINADHWSEEDFFHPVTGEMMGASPHLETCG